MNIWLFLSLQTAFFYLLLSLSLHPVSTCLTLLKFFIRLYAHPPPTAGAAGPSQEQSPLGVLYQSSGGRVAAAGSDSTFCHPPNQVQSLTVCPCFSSSSTFFFRLCLVQFLLVEGCFINAVLAQSGFFTHTRSLSNPATNVILKFLINFGWGNSIVYTLPDESI